MGDHNADHDPIAPPESETERYALGATRRLLEASSDCGFRLVGPAGDEIVLTESVIRALRQTVAILASDRVAYVSATTKQLTTDETAAL